ncbi:MAG TPA: DUF488 domain-containing protein [Gemmataceae bacterium]|jgi:uncharacterized protein (DUF488 family)|nr:DUF488 domain-containing protein [Gemmataceae bacterium]
MNDHGAAAARLFSVGHSNHELSHFVDLLRGSGITAVADVRSQPSSQRCPHFNRTELERELRHGDIAYAFLGKELGGRPGQPSLYDAEGRANYERVRKTAAFQRGLDQLVSALDQFTVAMLCSEEDPLDCHRGLMIAPALAERGIVVAHIRGDGSVEAAGECETRLLGLTGVGSGILDGLFADSVTADERQHLLAEAYRVQAQRKAFRLRPDTMAD